MGSASSIVERVCPIVQTAAATGERTAVVVSAMSGTTSELLAIAERAVAEGIVDTDTITRIRANHLSVAQHTKIESDIRSKLERTVDEELSKLTNLLSAIVIIRELPIRSQDAIIAVGEKLSAHLLVAALTSSGQPAQYLATESLIPATLRYECDTYWDQIEQLFLAALNELPEGKIPVIPGFFGPIDGGILESVGRGYSDYTASLVGSALGAREIQIWTDVDGVMSANPKVVPSAEILDCISYDEMAELAHFGAKVLHPFSVRPAVRTGIPIRILNTFNPAAPGTIVQVQHTSTPRAFKSIAYKRGITSVRITTPRMLMTHGFLAKLGIVLERHKTSIDLIATSEVSISFTIEDTISSADSLYRDLSQLGEVSTLSDQAIVSIVGTEIRNAPLFVSRAFRALEAAQCPCNLISFSDMKINLSLLVEDSECERAVETLHREFFA